MLLSLSISLASTLGSQIPLLHLLDDQAPARRRAVTKREACQELFPKFMLLVVVRKGLPPLEDI